MRLTLSVLLIGAALLAAEAPARAERSTPQPFSPGVISSPDHEEYRITFTPDGRTAYFTRADSFFPVSRQATIYESVRVGGGWGEPRVAPFSGTFSDIDPWITRDGRRLYFSSIRPVDGQEHGDLDVWFVERTRDGSWGPAQHAGDINLSGVNAAEEPVDELYPTVGPDGWLYIGSNRDGGFGGWDIWRAPPVGDGTFGPAENLGSAVNTGGWEFNPTFTPDGRHLLFTRIAEFAPPWGEIHAARRHHDGFGAPTSLTAVNTAVDEYHPSFSADGRTFYFVRNDLTETSNGNFYQLPTRDLGLPQR